MNYIKLIKNRYGKINLSTDATNYFILKICDDNVFNTKKEAIIFIKKSFFYKYKIIDTTIYGKKDIEYIKHLKNIKNEYKDNFILNHFLEDIKTDNLKFKKIIKTIQDIKKQEDLKLKIKLTLKLLTIIDNLTF